MPFPWMHSRRPPAPGKRRLEMYRRELVERAGLFYRLGYPQTRAAARLKANVAWDFEIGARRPKKLTDREIDGLVKETYRRRPAH